MEQTFPLHTVVTLLLLMASGPKEWESLDWNNTDYLCHVH
jgi:hypothetical protein